LKKKPTAHTPRSSPGRDSDPRASAGGGFPGGGSLGGVLRPLSDAPVRDSGHRGAGEGCPRLARTQKCTPCTFPPIRSWALLVGPLVVRITDGCGGRRPKYPLEGPPARDPTPRTGGGVRTPSEAGRVGARHPIRAGSGVRKGAGPGASGEGDPRSRRADSCLRSRKSPHKGPLVSRDAGVGARGFRDRKSFGFRRAPIFELYQRLINKNIFLLIGY
jgi:hypothetical protein